MNSIEIINFKNFKHLKIGNLGNVNLIVGRNNAGKSTLLEAISVLAAGAGIDWIKDLLEIRGINTRLSSINTEQPDMVELENFCTLYHSRNYQHFKHEPIKIISVDNDHNTMTTVEIKMVDLIEISEVDENGTEIRKRTIRDTDDNQFIDGDIQPGLLISYNDTKSVYPLGNSHRRYFMSEKNIPFEYVRTAEFTGDKNPSLFDKVALTPLEPILIEALHIIDRRIDAINFLKDDSRPRMWVNQMHRANDDNRIPFVTMEGAHEKYRLSTMGDGINRILTIILSMLNCRNGILLIDEFENGLHYSVQTGLWQLICRLSKELNIQVFATTHSRDCIKSFLNATRDTGISRLIRLENRTSGEVAVMYDDSEELDYIIDNDVETR